LLPLLSQDVSTMGDSKASVCTSTDMNYKHLEK